MSQAKTIAQPAPAKSKLWKPPIVGIVTFVLMFVGVGLGHTVMVLIEHDLGRETTLAVSPLLGFSGIVMLWYGVKSKNETFQTWIGLLRCPHGLDVLGRVLLHVVRPEELRECCPGCPA
jgi:hypothetical protein